MVSRLAVECQNRTIAGNIALIRRTAGVDLTRCPTRAGFWRSFRAEVLMVRRHVGDVEVAGSTPAGPTRNLADSLKPHMSLGTGLRTFSPGRGNTRYPVANACTPFAPARVAVSGRLDAGRLD